MPNHIESKLTIHGPQEIIDRLIEVVEGDGPFDCNKIIVQPAHIILGDLGMEEQEANPNRNWYNWNTKHWGSKWGVYDASRKQSDNLVTYRFRSAWNPIEPVVQELMWFFPELSATFEFIDEGWDFSGYIKYRGGNRLYKQSVDCNKENKEFQKLYQTIHGVTIEENDANYEQ